jgi:hypothetical protein
MFVMVTGCVLFKVRPGFLNIIYMSFEFSSVVRQMQGYDRKRGTAFLPQSWRPSDKKIPSTLQRPSATAIPFLYVQLGDIHPTKVLFVTGQLA